MTLPLDLIPALPYTDSGINFINYASLFAFLIGVQVFTNVREFWVLSFKPCLAQIHEVIADACPILAKKLGPALHSLNFLPAIVNELAQAFEAKRYYQFFEKASNYLQLTVRNSIGFKLVYEVIDCVCHRFYTQRTLSAFNDIHSLNHWYCLGSIIVMLKVIPASYGILDLNAIMDQFHIWVYNSFSRAFNAATPLQADFLSEIKNPAFVVDNPLKIKISEEVMDDLQSKALDLIKEKELIKEKAIGLIQENATDPDSGLPDPDNPNNFWKKVLGVLKSPWVVATVGLGIGIAIGVYWTH